MRRLCVCLYITSRLQVRYLRPTCKDKFKIKMYIFFSKTKVIGIKVLHLLSYVYYVVNNFI